MTISLPQTEILKLPFSKQKEGSYKLSFVIITVYHLEAIPSNYI